jgi:hypothetical protein
MAEPQITSAVPWAPHDECDRILRAYYEKLNAHKPFSEALASLITELATLLDNEPDANEILNAPPAAQRANTLRRLEELSRDPGTPPDTAEDCRRRIRQIRLAGQVQSTLQQFTTDWHLPTDVGPKDLASSYRLRARLRRVARFTSLPARGPRRVVGYEPAEGDRPAVQFVAHEPVLTVRLGYECDYDPLADSRQVLRERIQGIIRAARADIKKNLMDQALEMERKLAEDGFRPPGPNARVPGHSQRVARRMFEYNILRKKWDDIADAENSEAGEAGDPNHPAEGESIRKTTSEWARRCRIPLRKPQSRKLTPPR